MLRMLSVVPLVLLSFVATGCSSYSINGIEAKHRTVRAFVLDAPATLDVDVRSRRGRVDIGPAGTPIPAWYPWHLGDAPQVAEGQVLVLAVVQSDLEWRVPKAHLEPEVTGDRLELRATWPKPGDESSGDGVEYVIRIPVSGNLEVGTDFGDITVAGVAGTAHLHSSFGDITVADHRGTLRSVTSFGDVTATLHPESPGPVTLETSFGDVTLTCGPAFRGDLRAYTSFGDVSYDSSDMSAPRAVTLDGSRLRVRDPQGEGPDSVLGTSFGDVVVRIADPGE